MQLIAILVLVGAGLGAALFSAWMGHSGWTALAIYAAVIDSSVVAWILADSLGRRMGHLVHVTKRCLGNSCEPTDTNQGLLVRPTPPQAPCKPLDHADLDDDQAVAQQALIPEPNESDSSGEFRDRPSVIHQGELKEALDGEDDCAPGGSRG